MTTLKEIARRANVSIATVSKALNGKGGASQKTLDKILALAEELNYTPNLYAKNLVRQESRTLGLITEDLTVFNTPEIVDSINETCEKYHYHYILGNLRINKRFGHDFSYSATYHQLVADMINTMLSKQVEGIIYIGCTNNAIPYLPATSSIPYVCAYCYSNEPSISSVIYDDLKAAYNVTSLLIAQGHKNIGMICGLPDSEATVNRTAGYKAALADHGIPYDPAIVSNGDWSQDSGYNICPGILSRQVTAIFAHNDVMAVGVIDYCNDNKITVGKDLALVGFDNRQISMICRPQLTTVALPLAEIGSCAASTMIDILTGKTPSDQKIMLSCPIIERDTTFTFK